VRVTAISLNRGEVKRALSVSEPGTCPGWDFAGVVESSEQAPGAPSPGTRVVGMLPIGAWKSRVSAPVHFIAPIPRGVSDAQAASLPVAGLTALHALRKGGLILGKKVLIDGASGGVGLFAVQLAAAAGAKVFAHVRRPEHCALIESAATGALVVGESLEAARSFGPFDLVIDGVGGAALSSAMTMLRRRGVCVTYGATDEEPVRFDNGAFFRASGTSLTSLILGDEFAAVEPASEGLAILLDLVGRRLVTPHIGVEAP
jgi:NADPH:quinone reductase